MERREAAGSVQQVLVLNNRRAVNSVPRSPHPYTEQTHFIQCRMLLHLQLILPLLIFQRMKDRGSLCHLLMGECCYVLHWWHFPNSSRELLLPLKPRGLCQESLVSLLLAPRKPHSRVAPWARAGPQSTVWFGAGGRCSGKEAFLPGLSTLPLFQSQKILTSIKSQWSTSPYCLCCRRWGSSCPQDCQQHQSPRRCLLQKNPNQTE